MKKQIYKWIFFNMGWKIVAQLIQTLKMRNDDYAA
jgi:hypothetical protein